MADNLTTTTAIATIPNATVVETRDQGSGVQRQVVTSATVIYPTANFNRVADTNTYATGDLIGQSVTAASVVAMVFSVAASVVTVGKATISIRRFRLKKTSVTTSVSAFRLHLFISDPAASTGITSGDNVAWSVKDAANLYLGAMDCLTMQAFNDCALGHGTPIIGSEINVVPTSANIYGLLEARAAYVPTSAETFTVHLEGMDW